MFVKPFRLLGDIKKANVLHHPVQAKNLHFNPYIYILYHQICRTISHPALLVTFLKRFILFVTGVLEQPSSETLVHNVMAIC